MVNKSFITETRTRTEDEFHDYQEEIKNDKTTILGLKEHLDLLMLMIEEKSGAVSVEHVLLLILIAVVAVLGFSVLGPAVKSLFEISF